MFEAVDQYRHGMGYITAVHLAAQHPIDQGAQPFRKPFQSLFSGLVENALAAGMGQRHQVIGGGGFGGVGQAVAIVGGVF